MPFRERCRAGRCSRPVSFWHIYANVQQQITTTDAILTVLRQLMAAMGAPQMDKSDTIGPSEAILRVFHSYAHTPVPRAVVIQEALNSMTPENGLISSARRKVIDQTIRNLEAKGVIERADEGLQLAAVAQRG